MSPQLQTDSVADVHAHQIWHRRLARHHRRRFHFRECAHRSQRHRALRHSLPRTAQGRDGRLRPPLRFRYRRRRRRAKSSPPPELPSGSPTNRAPLPPFLFSCVNATPPAAWSSPPATILIAGTESSTRPATAAARCPPSSRKSKTNWTLLQNHSATCLAAAKGSDSHHSIPARPTSTRSKNLVDWRPPARSQIPFCLRPHARLLRRPAARAFHPQRNCPATKFAARAIPRFGGAHPEPIEPHIQPLARSRPCRKIRRRFLLRRRRRPHRRHRPRRLLPQSPPAFFLARLASRRHPQLTRRYRQNFFSHQAHRQNCRTDSAASSTKSPSASNTSAS